MEIGKKGYRVVLDFGAEQTALYPKDLCEIDKRACGNQRGVGVRGYRYDRAMFEVSGVKISEFYVPKMKVLEETSDFQIHGVITGDLKDLTYYGRIGREAFDGKNFLLDFPHSKMIICKNFKDLAKDGYNLENFIKVPFKMERIGICIPVETDVGEQILLLDTGASLCFLRPPLEKEKLSIDPSLSAPIWRSQTLTLSGHEFGPRNFTLFEISPILDEIDGVLGNDFLKEHAVYIDMKKSVAYIEKNT